MSGGHLSYEGGDEDFSVCPLFILGGQRPIFVHGFLDLSHLITTVIGVSISRSTIFRYFRILSSGISLRRIITSLEDIERCVNKVIEQDSPSDITKMLILIKLPILVHSIFSVPSIRSVVSCTEALDMFFFPLI